MKIFNSLKKLNKLEKIYILIFLGSLLAGIINGAIDKSYFTCCEDAIGVPPEGTSVLKIFQSNFILSITEMLTAGLASLYYNFHTFSITSSYLISQNALYAIIIILLIGSFELLGSLLMALIGISFVEKLFKIKTKLNWTLLFYGVALIFIGAVVEYLLLKPII